jgi:cobalt-zinc-cadmium resistance protein CzcA
VNLLSAIVAWSLRNRAVVLVATVLFVLGLRSATLLPDRRGPRRHQRPGPDHHRAPALSPVEVEQYVSGPGRAGDVRHAPRRPRSARSPSTASRSSPSCSRTAPTSTSRASWSTSACARPATPSRTTYGVPEMGPISTGLGEIFQFVDRNDNLTLMQLEELLDWYIAPAASERPRHRRGEQLRRRGPRVPGRARSRAPAGRSGLSIGEVVSRSRSRTRTPAAATSSTTRSTSSSAPTAS